MAGETPKGLELDFLVAYPREAEVGKKYLMTVDLRVRGPVQAWPYDEEEYPLYLMVDSEPAFDNEPVGQSTVVLHRFGGTYGPARFVLTARKPTEQARVSISLVNSAGLSLRKQSLPDMRVVPAVAARPPPRPRPTPKVAPPDSIGWLHLSNLALGEGSPDQWERSLQVLLEDLDQLYEKSGPWDLIFCSGDLTQRGRAEEFEEVSELFEELERHLVELGMTPRILAVPGNHDLERKGPVWNAVQKYLASLPEVPAAIPWKTELGSLFQNYSLWWNAWSSRGGNNLKRGALPGDFSMVFERGDMRLGIVGLNDGLEQGRDVEKLRAQLDYMCEGDFDRWSRGVDACVLLAHERMRALEPQWARRKQGEPFLLQLVGRSASREIPRAELSSAPMLVLHGRKLFPIETGEAHRGYLAGRISFETDRGRVRVWPRRAKLSGSRGLRIEADRSSRLDADEGMEAAVFTRPSESVREAREDWAIVVGINHYPEMTDLRGAENDARAFEDWLLETAKVPPEQVSTLLSSSFPPSEAPSEAKPGPAEVEALFDRLANMASESQRLRGSMRVGRRLYVYVSGHGVELAGGEPVLLTADAGPRKLAHVAPRVYAEWFRQTGSFDEVLLFFDCDRRGVGRVPLSVPPYLEPRVERGSSGKLFSALAPRMAGERQGDDGQVRGVFTSVLLEGLTGDASDDAGRVTARSLTDYLSMINPQLPSEELPEIVYDTAPDFVIARVPPMRYRLEFQVEPRLIGRVVRLVNYRSAVVTEFEATASRRFVDVARGFYLVSVEGMGGQQPFMVEGTMMLELSEDKEGRLQLRVTPGGAGEEASPPPPPGSLLFNGIEVETGQYQVSPIDPERAVQLVVESGPSLVRGIVKDLEAMPFEGMQPESLSEVGWGLVSTPGLDPSIRDALMPLMTHRAKAAQSSPRIFHYHPGDRAMTWLLRRRADSGPVPYHLLIVGGPEEIPFEFQQELSLTHSVGRLSFDTPEEYAHYVSRVLEYELGSRVLTPRRITYWSPRHSGDEVSKRINDQLIAPLHEGGPDKGERPIARLLRMEAQRFQGDEATTSRLSAVLKGRIGDPSALVFAAAHGVTSSRYHDLQGGLLGQEWVPFKPVSPSMIVAREEPGRADQSSRSLIAFFFASFSAGTSLADPFSRSLVPRWISERPFVARLPRQLLALRGSGMLAVLGQVDWAWATVGGEEVAPRPHVPYRDCIGRILGGTPVGHAVREEFGRRQVRASRALRELLNASDRRRSTWQAQVVHEWLNLLDARSLVVLGDPAVRLNFEMDAKK